MVNGIIHEDMVNDFKAPENSVNEAVNLHFDTMGSARLRPGVTLLGNQIDSGTDILGVHQFIDEGTGTDSQILAVNGTVLYYLSGSTWTSLLTGITTGLKMRFTNFANRVMFTNGTDLMRSWNGDSGATPSLATNVSGAPAAHYIDNYRSRVWLANTDDNPQRIWYSSVISSSGTITWNTSTGFIDIVGGGDITAIKKSPRALLVFTPSITYRVFNHNEADPDPQIFVGTYSQESVVKGKDGIYFHDWDNAAIHRYDGTAPVEISRAIFPYLQGVTLANRNDVAGWADSDHVYWSVGNISLNNITFNNVVFRYTVSTEVWTIYSYPQQFLAGTWYDDGTTREPVVADDDGNLLTFNNGNTDNSTAISFSLVTRWHDLSGVLSYQDTITRLAALSRNGQGVNISYQTDLWNNEAEWEPIGKIREVPRHIFDEEITANKVRFRISGNSSGEPFMWEGFEILEGFSELMAE